MDGKMSGIHSLTSDRRIEHVRRGEQGVERYLNHQDEG